MKSVYLIGGRQRSSRQLFENDQHWYDYQKGVILQIDLDSGRADTRVEYESLPGTCAPGDPILFKAGTVAGNRLYACTQTEILIYTLPGFEQAGHLSLPCFNDVHHVRPTPAGNLLVANSGLEMVMEITPGGQVLQEWNVLGEEPWGNFSREIDYRQGINLKPHRAHPNYVYYLGEEIWATRFECRDAVCLTRPGRRLPIGIERVHDGVFYNERLHFTTVDGRLVIANPEPLAIETVVNLRAMHDPGILLGWCRGLLLEEGRAWVGFSRIRPTKFRDAVSWIRQGFQRSRPTHIACYDLVQKRCLVEFNLEDYGLNAVFSILPAFWEK